MDSAETGFDTDPPAWRGWALAIAIGAVIGVLLGVWALLSAS